MNLKIILLLIIFGCLNFFGTEAFKRIKRASDAQEIQNNRIKQDFIMLHSGERNLNENLQKSKSEAAAQYVTVLDSAAKRNTSHIFLPDIGKNLSISKPFASSLSDMERKVTESQRQHRKVLEGISVNEDKKNLSNYEERLRGKSEGLFRHHKNKHLPHGLHSEGIVQAKFILPLQHNRQSTYRGLSSFASMEPLMKIGKELMFKIGLDSSPYPSRYSREHMTQNSDNFVGKENFERTINEGGFDYVFNYLEEPKGNYFRPQTLQLPGDGSSTYQNSIIYKPAVPIGEPIQLANLMQTAVDALLLDDAGIDNVAGSKNKIEFTCPMHKAQTSADNKDVMQVCSCRLIKRAKEDKKKL